MLVGCKAASNANSTNAANGSNGTLTSSGNQNAQPSPTATMTAAAPAESPTEAFRQYYDAVKRKDPEAIKSLFSKGTVTMLDDQAKRRNKALDVVLKEGVETMNKWVPEAFPEIRNEKIDGDTATIEVKDDKGDKWDTLHLVREDGGWKLAFDKRAG